LSSQSVEVHPPCLLRSFSMISESIRRIVFPMGLESFDTMNDDLESQLVHFGWTCAHLIEDSSHAQHRQYQSVKIM
jgi:hypothetical protein